MKPVQQTILGPPTGNCLAACVATLFDLPIWMVPNFVAADRWRAGALGWFRTNPDQEPLWWGRLCSFAAEQGWRVFHTSPSNLGRGLAAKFLYGDYAIATIDSSAGRGAHCVIAEILTGEVVWDPHPDGMSEGHTIPAREIQDWIMFVALK